MNIKQVTGIYFSPTESTKAVVENIAAGLCAPTELVNLTDWKLVRPDYGFLENEAVVVGVPVYGGRVPETAAKRLENLHGRGTPAIGVVVYGNRDFDDALIELKDILNKQGFRMIAAAAVSAEHNIAQGVATGRPDEKDKTEIHAFALQVKEHIYKAFAWDHLSEVSVPGNHPYRIYSSLPMKIKVKNTCDACGLCIRKCPVQAISRTDAKTTDTKSCILCMRCVHVCPRHARGLGMLFQMGANKMLKKVCAERKEAKFFL